MAAVTLLSARGLSRNFGGLRAVHDVDFDLAEGEIRALIGPNGAGKTTFVGMLCGRIAPTAGSVSFGGKDISSLPAHRRARLGIAYTFQITSVFRKLSVHENVALAAGARLSSPARLRKAVNTALDRVGLSDRAEQLAGDLAYGHQRLLEIAMGISQNPKLLILDEPTQGLSDGEIENFKTLVRDLAKQSAVLIIEHNMDVVMQTADRITVLAAGEILAEGSPQDIRANAAVQAAYLGTG